MASDAHQVITFSSQTIYLSELAISVFFDL
mgnify:CR=1 FL=1